MNEKKSLILMVEDEEQVLNTNCRMLRRRGYDVRTAQTAAEACHQLEEQLPDLLILDIMLPDGNGLDICRRFREKTMNPVLFLTGKSNIRDRVEGLQQGGDYYLTKPYNFDEFLAVIQMLLERQKRMEEKIKEKFQSSRQITIGSLRLDLSDGHAYLNNADTVKNRLIYNLHYRVRPRAGRRRATQTAERNARARADRPTSRPSNERTGHGRPRKS